MRPFKPSKLRGTTLATVRDSGALKRANEYDSPPEPILPKCPFCGGYLSAAKFMGCVECVHCGRRWRDQ